ncbi:hypothetical protein ACJIZ3_014002 [Penstemon smallii]|uniref:ferric-chelate reductase (NADH) n=1 Tax=Penstemon smallii TaxID=265156 RepID=A0ABD3RIG7_9LAMI
MKDLYLVWHGACLLISVLSFLHDFALCCWYYQIIGCGTKFHLFFFFQILYIYWEWLSYSPTSILFVIVPSICKLQWHPFTIISNSNLEPEKLCFFFDEKLNHLNVSTEGHYGPASSDFLSHESLVMISGGSGIAPFISIIREIIFASTQSNKKVPKVLLIAAFKNSTDLTMLDLLLPLSSTTLDICKLELQIEAYVSQEHDKRSLDDAKKQIQTRLFKPNPSDSPISAAQGENSWLWLGAIISSSFVLFLLPLGVIIRYHIYPVEKRGDNYHYSSKIIWDMFLVCVSIFVATSAIFLWQKRDFKGREANSELESLLHQSLVQSSNVHFGVRPDLKRILFDCKASDVGVLVCVPKSMRHEVAKICASGLAKNLHFEFISFNW